MASSPPERLRKPLENDAAWLLRRIWDRINERNQHFVLCIVGEEGIGKSWTAMKFAHEVDPTFTAERVIFDVADLLRILKDRDHEPGEFYVLDEAGVQLGRRTWHQRSQILTNQAFQLIRNHNLGLIFTLPRLGELDSMAQGRLQAFLEILEKEEGEFTRGKLKLMDPDRTDETGKIYKKYPRRVMGTGGVTHRLTSVAFRPPPPELTEPYEERKRTFQERTYERTLRELEGGEEDGEEDGDDGLTPVEVVERLEDGEGLDAVVSLHGVTGEPYIEAGLIEVEFGLSARDAKKVKKLAEKSNDIDISEYE